MEKRKFLRLEDPLDVTIKLVPSLEPPQPPPLFYVKSRNISREGICLETKFIAIDGFKLIAGSPGARENRLDIAIQFVPDEPPFRALGELAWYDVVPDSRDFIYLMGVEFLEISDTGKERLTNFLKRHEDNRGFYHRLIK